MANVIARFIDLVSAYDGVGVTSDKQRYLDLIAQGEEPCMQEELCRDSGCALVVRGFWRMFGVKDRRLAPPYAAGKAVTWLVALAQERGAWVNSNTNKLPGVGDMVLVGGDRLHDGGVEHVYIAVELKADPLTVHSLDGGQVDEHRNQVIRRKQRHWIVQGGTYWDVVVAGTDPGAAARGGRRVKGWVDLEKLVGADGDAGAAWPPYNSPV